MGEFRGIDVSQTSTHKTSGLQVHQVDRVQQVVQAEQDPSARQDHLDLLDLKDLPVLLASTGPPAHQAPKVREVRFVEAPVLSTASRKREQCCPKHKHLSLVSTHLSVNISTTEAFHYVAENSDNSC